MENETNKLIAEEAKKLKELDERKKALTQELDEVKSEMQKQNDIVAQMLCDVSLDSIETDNTTFTLTTDCLASVIAGTKAETFAEFKKDEELSTLIKEEVNTKTFSAYIKEYKKEHVGKLPDLLQKLLDEKKISIYEPYKIKMKTKKV